MDVANGINYWLQAQFYKIGGYTKRDGVVERKEDLLSLKWVQGKEKFCTMVLW